MIVAAPLTSLATPPGGWPIAVPAVERFRSLIAQQLGLQYEDDKLDWLAALLTQRVKATGSPNEHCYVDALAADHGGDEWAALAPTLTVAETYFFRHVEQFHALRQRVLPDRMKRAAKLRPLRILSAGCASGEEAYSVAMTIASTPEWENRDVRIDAIDLNPVVLAKARAGRFRGWSLRETPDAMRQKWFTEEGQEYVLDERIRAMVRFSRCNLADADDPFWQSDRYDVVLCRNVLMYFGTPRMQQVLARFARALMDGGYLMMGHAESLRGLSSDFRLRHSHGTFYYQLADAKTPSSIVEPGQGAEPRAASGEEPQATDDTTGWIQAIGRSAARVRALSSSHASVTSTPDKTSASSLGPDSSADHTTASPDQNEELLILLDKEQFQEALMLFESRPDAQAHAEPEPWLHVLHASLLMHVGRIDEAEALCRRHLAAHPFQADLHHAMALCLEAAGRLAEAMESDRTAAFIDPSFAMPHVHLGSVARRVGDAATCKRAFSMALRLLGHESHERLRLFAGGFSREALRALCQSELNTPGEGR